MNLRSRLEHIAQMLDAGRGFGKTTMMAKACKDLDGIYLCNSHAEAKKVKHEHQVPTESIDKNLHGYIGPFFIDHHATAQLLHRAASKIKELEEENKTLQIEKENLEYKVMDLLSELSTVEY